ncbi:MAG: hypothetical protein GY765_11175 [bacterium]|nr:hypothetical protein [bacterium]
MSNEQDLALKLETLESLPADKALSPTIPVHICVQEAEDLASWCVDDREQLEAIGLDWTVVDDIPIRAGALREQETIWLMAVSRDNEDAARWAAESGKAADLRTVLLHKFRFAFRNDEELMSKLRTIDKGLKQTNLIQGLNHLCYLGRNNPELLEALKIETALLDEATRYSDVLATFLADARKAKEKIEVKRVLRDKAYYHLKEGVDTVRGYGHYLFWRRKDRLKGYTCAYMRNKRKAADNDTNDIDDSDAGGVTEPEFAQAVLEAGAPDIAAESTK